RAGSHPQRGVSGPGGEVGLGGERLDGLAEVGTGLLDLCAQGLRIRGWLLRHDCRPSRTAVVTVSMSSATPAMASVGIGGAARRSWRRPARAAPAAATRTTNMTTSTANHNGHTSASA